MTPAADGKGQLHENNSTKRRLKSTCSMFNSGANFRFNGCDAIEGPNMISLFQCDHIRILLRRPLLNDVL